MGKISYVKIAGKNYPMSFSLGVTKKLISEYGSVEKMKAKLSKPGKEEEKMDAVVDMLAILIAQGCAYKNFFESELPAPDDAPIIDGKWTALPREAIEISVDIFEVEGMVNAIMQCIDGGSKKEVEGKPDKKM